MSLSKLLTVLQTINMFAALVAAISPTFWCSYYAILTKYVAAAPHSLFVFDAQFVLIFNIFVKFLETIICKFLPLERACISFAFQAAPARSALSLFTFYIRKQHTPHFLKLFIFFLFPVPSVGLFLNVIHESSYPAVVFDFAVVAPLLSFIHLAGLFLGNKVLQSLHILGRTVLFLYSLWRSGYAEDHPEIFAFFMLFFLSRVGFRPFQYVRIFATIAFQATLRLIDSFSNRRPPPPRLLAHHTTQLLPPPLATMLLRNVLDACSNWERVGLSLSSTEASLLYSLSGRIHAVCESVLQQHIHPHLPSTESPTPGDATKSEADLCVACLELAASITFTPCGHTVVCERCFALMGHHLGSREGKELQCAVCRMHVACARAQGLLSREDYQAQGTFHTGAALVRLAAHVSAHRGLLARLSPQARLEFSRVGVTPDASDLEPE